MTIGDSRSVKYGLGKDYDRMRFAIFAVILNQKNLMYCLKMLLLDFFPALSQCRALYPPG